MDLSKLSDSDLQLVAKGQVNMMSNDGLNLLANPPQDSLATKVIRGAGDVAGGVVSGLTDIGKTISRPVNAILDKASPLPNGLSHTQDMSNRLGGLMGSLFNTDSTAFKAGSLGGNIIGTLPVGGVLGSGIAKVLPRLGSAVTSGGMTLGRVAGKPLADLGIRAAGAGINGAATAGLIDPNSTAEGGLLSAVLPVAGKGLGLLGGAIGSLKGVNASPLLDSAINQYKLPLSLSDISNNGFVKGANSLINDIPIIGRIGQNHQADLQGAFNREIGKTFGAYGDSLTPEILAKAKTDLGSNYDKLWNGNKFVLDRQFANDATNIIHDAGQSLNPDQAKTLSNQFDNLLGKVNNNEVDGSFVNDISCIISKLSINNKLIAIP